MSDRPSHFKPEALPMPSMASLYRGNEFSDPLSQLRPRYQPPEIFEHGRETLVAEVPQIAEDGLPVRVFEIRCPAAFYVVEADGFRFETGSGHSCGELAVKIARAFAVGSLRVSAIAPAPATYPEGEDAASLEGKN